MNRQPVYVRPTMIPPEPTMEPLLTGSEPCPEHCVTDQDARPVRFGWFKFPRLRRQRGLATGIIGLW